MSYQSIACELIKRHEGLKLNLYECTAGKKTIGYGRNIEDNGITQDEADLMLANDLNACAEDLEHFHFWKNLNDTRKAVLTDMRYNLGPSRLRQFKNMLDAITKEDYSRAALEMLDSSWSKQVGQRAITLSKLMRAGQ